MKKICAVIQARMSSQRFPGKVLTKVNGKPLLGYLLESLEHCPGIEDIVVATSDEQSDTPVSQYCRKEKIQCYRGPLEDVAARFIGAMETYEMDAFVRVCGDSPLLLPETVNKGITLFETGNYQIVTNTLKRSFPKGQTVEIVEAETYRNAYPAMKTPGDLEHVTPYFYRNHDKFKIHNFRHKKDCSTMQMSVDCPEELDTVAHILDNMEKPHWQYSVDELIKFYSAEIK